MLPRKKQKLEQEVEATSSDGRGQHATGSQDSLLRFHDTAQKEGTPEPSGNRPQLTGGAFYPDAGMHSSLPDCNDVPTQATLRQK